MKRKSFNRLFHGFSAIVLVLSLVLSPVQAFAATEVPVEQDETEIETVNDEEQQEMGQAEETAEEDEVTEESVATEESADAEESEGQPADEMEEAEVAEAVVNTEATAEQDETKTEQEVEVVEQEEQVEEKEESTETEINETTTPAQTEDDESEIEEPELNIFEDVVTKDSVSISWELIGLQDVEEFEVYLNFEHVDTVSADTASYTFEGLTVGEQYDIHITATTDEDYVSSAILSSTPYWTEADLIPVSVHTNVDVDFDDFDTLLIRGNEESTEAYEEAFQPFWVNGKLVTSLPVGKFEAVLYNDEDPSISESTTFEIKDGVNYKNNPIQLQFNLDEMREAAEPFEFEIIDVDETSFTMKWSDVSKLLGIRLSGSGKDLGDTWDFLDEIQLDNDTTEFTVTDLRPNLLYSIFLDLNYVYELGNYKDVKVKTEGEDAEAPEVPFVNDNLKQAVSEEVGVHTRDVTEKDIGYLERLYADQAGIDSLEGLELAHNLKSLNLWENEISDLSPLEALENLEELYIRDNQVRDLSYLENLSTLTRLSVSNNEISDLSPLSNLTNLTTLRIDNNEIENIDILDNFNQIRILDISGNPLTDYSVVEDLTTLIDLSMGSLDISDISFVSNLKEVFTLNLSNNAIEDIQVLSGLEKLTNLYLGGNEISDLTPLEELTNLFSLYLGSNNITDISSLANLKEIEYLILSDNPIEGVGVLSELPNLQEVYLYGVELSNDDYELLERLSRDGVQVYHEDFIDNRGDVEDPEEEEPVEDEDTEDEDTGSDDEGTEDDNTGSNDEGTKNDNTNSGDKGTKDDVVGSDNEGTEGNDKVTTENENNETEEDDVTVGERDSKGTNGGKEAVADADQKETSTSSDEKSEGTGSTLPNTATDIYNLILLGAIILVVGMISLYFTRKTKTSN